MSVIVKPPLVPESISMRLERSTRVVRSAEGGSFQREVREGQERWIADVTWPPLHGQDRRELEAFLELAGRGDSHVMIDWPFGHGGNFPSGNVIENSDFNNGTAAWAHTGGLSVESRRAKVYSESAAQNIDIRQEDLSLNSFPFYSIEAYLYFKSPDLSNMVLSLIEVGTGSIGSRNKSASQGRWLFAVTPNATTAHTLRFRWNRSTNPGDFFVADNISLHRCLRAPSGAAAGAKSIAVDKAVGTTAGQLLAGDFVEIVNDSTPKTELKRLVTDFGTEANSDDGVLHFEPALRNDVGSGRQIILRRPSFKAIMSNANQQRRYTQPDYIQVTQRFEEDILA